MKKLTVESELGPKCPLCGHQKNDMGDYTWAQATDEEWECVCGAICTVTCETYTVFDYKTTLVSEPALEGK